MAQRLIIHIGLHKTGTTFYQRGVWPHWEGLGYAGKPRPKTATSLEASVRAIDDPVVLLSDESSSGSLKRAYLTHASWSGLLTGALEKLRTLYGNDYQIDVLISLRRHDKWILSIYKHYLKYGGVETLDNFLGLDKTPATLAPEDLSLMQKIRRVEDLLDVTPFCFFLEETRLYPERLAQALAAFAGTGSGPGFSVQSQYNEGVNTAEAKLCRNLNRLIANPGCSGKGWLKRNRTLAFSLARNTRELGLLPRGSELQLGPRAQDYVREHLTHDLEETTKYLCRHRGLDQNTYREQLDLYLPG